VSNNSVLQLPSPDTQKLRCARELTFQSSLYSIGISEFARSQILMHICWAFSFPEFLKGCATCPPIDACGPTLFLWPVGISRFTIPNCKSILSSGPTKRRTPTSSGLPTRVPNDRRFRSNLRLHQAQSQTIHLYEPR
jgi:hypothetical protein